MLGHGIANLRAPDHRAAPGGARRARRRAGARGARRARARPSGLDIELDVRLAYEEGRATRRHVPELEASLYRLVQEALTNVVKHAERARGVRIAVADDDDGRS